MNFRYIILLISLFCLNSYAGTIDKPKGCFSSMLTERAAQNPNMQGGLVRTSWAKLEPNPGTFDFSSIDQQLRLLPEGKEWSLAVYAGWTSITLDSTSNTNRRLNKQRLSRRALQPHTPTWLVSKLGIKTFKSTFRGNTTEMPKYWDPVVQKRLTILMNALSQKYKADSRLKLVYVPQMTSNGIEGHFNGVPANSLLQAAGLKSTDKKIFEEIWTNAALSAIRTTTEAFDNKAIAFELHELLGNSAIPKKIMVAILKDPALKDQVGIGMWWISGKNNYQSALLRLLEKYPGDIYGQVIGRSDQEHRFPDGDYSAVFKQAKKLGMRYIEPWNYEFENHTHDKLLKDFNRYCEKRYAAEK